MGGGGEEQEEGGMAEEARKKLKEFFGHNDFRTGQEEAVRAAMQGRDALVVMATGSGKSLCYQVPAVMGGDGVVVVVSPLISLMHDQVCALRARNVEAATSAERTCEADVFQGRARMLYTTPEAALGCACCACFFPSCCVVLCWVLAVVVIYHSLQVA